MREMKDSGVEWLGTIPENWEIVPNKVLMKKKKVICDTYNGEDILSLTMNGVIVRDLDAGGKMPLTFDGYQFVEPGNLLMCLFDIDVTPRCIGIIKNKGLTSPAYSQFAITDKATVGYYYYYYLMLDNDKTLLHLAKNLRNSLTEDVLGAVPTLCPPIAEQSRITDYLDAQCAKIDAVIERQRAAIEKLKAYKLAVITEAVTKGLNPDVEMKDSGIEWIAKTPIDWKLSHIGNLVEMGSGGTPDRNKPEYWEGGTIPWMSSGEINYEYVHSTSEKITELGLQNSNAKLLPVNTVMLGLIGQGKTKGLTAILKTEVACNQNLAYLIADEKFLHYRYLFYCFKAMYHYIRGLVGESQAGIYSYFLKKIHIPLPIIQEQKDICDFLDGKCDAIENSVSKKQAVIEKLTAYKKSLIYEVVTGKKEV